MKKYIITPKHGSWLNMAEIELSVLSRQCLDQRIGTLRLLERDVAAWTKARNARATTVDWQFTTADARIKLKRLYPVLAEGVLPPLAEVTAPGLSAAIQTKRESKSRREAAASVEQATKASSRSVAHPVVHGQIT